MASSAPFSEWSKEVAGEFLANVLIVDDRARLSAGDESIQPTTLVAPMRQATITTASTGNTAPGTGNGAHSLYAKALIDQFAEHGIICGVFCPSREEIDSFARDFFLVIERADVVILDWVLHEYKNGEKTLEILRELQKTTKKEKGRARLVLIYSGENDLTRIVSDIKKALKAVDGDDPYTVQAGPIRITVYAKEESRVLEEHRHRRLKETDLPETVITEFSLMTGGLVSNVALKSLAVLRANTHQLLSTFNRNLDAPYVTHRTLLLPEEASDHIVPLLVAEIQSILEDERVGDLAGSPNVAKWLKYQVGRGVKFSFQHTDELASLKGMAFLLRRGVGDAAITDIFAAHKKFAAGMLHDPKKAAKQVWTNLTERLTLPSELPNVSDQDLAMLMSIRSRYTTPQPVLRLGSIVLERTGKHSEFLLCVQPLCDSVRIDKERSFPFLPLKKVQAGAACDFLIKDNGQTLRFSLRSKPFEARMVMFTPRKEHREIVARTAKTGRFFKAASGQSTYRWIADLKPDHAQRVANDYAYKISRVGLTESEWLRKQSQRVE